MWRPDTRGSWRFLWSLLLRRPGLLVASALSGAAWMLPTALLPLVLGRAIDTGIRLGDGAALWGWIGVIALIGIVQTVGSGVLCFSSHTMWIHAVSTTQRVTIRHAVGLGFTLPRRMRSGEVVAISGTDTVELGAAFEVFGRLCGAVLSFLIAAVASLWISPLLGGIMLVGVPLTTLGLAPMLGPLRKRGEVKRERLSEVTIAATDIVSGLRVLRGIGGENAFHQRFVQSSQRLRAAGVRAGSFDAWLAAAEALLPGLVTVLVTFTGAHLALAGTISAGELVAFYGISAFLVLPVRTATAATDAVSTALVAAGRIRSLLNITSDAAAPSDPTSLPQGSFGLRDQRHGLDLAPGELTVIDAGPHGEALAEHLAGHVDLDGLSVHTADAAVPLARVRPDELRARVVLAHNQDLLFSGPLRAGLDLGTAVDVDTALHAADAHDVVEAMPDDVLDERGRTLSGGQRQRLLLARALCSDADVLVLDEPTSAVDAHTEARIVERLSRLRAGRTTVVLTQSPLWKNAADHTSHLEGLPV